MSFPLFFDKHDREILQMINTTLDSDLSDKFQKTNLDHNLHPRGIIELTTTREFRVAYAVISLLTNIEKGSIEDRLNALKTLHDEVLHSAHTSFRYNTGRVLIQIMKEIIRSRNNHHNQLKLVHDFRNASTGKPRVIRKMLKKHLLLEMPEEWNQLTMDHHVHDANTKGRKNPTHLIMDAWIKGIRTLTVVYYNYLHLKTAREVLQAADIMGISVRIGIEFRAAFNNHLISFMWVPRGFSDTEGFIKFFEQPQVQQLMEEGKQASLWAQKNVLLILDRWNTEYKKELESELDIIVPRIEHQEFLDYVGKGQTSFLHLTEFIYKKIFPIIEEKKNLLELEYPPKKKQPQNILSLIKTLNSITVDTISNRWFKLYNNPEIDTLFQPDKSKDIPKIVALSPHTLLKKLSQLHSGYRITLQLSGLTPEDVLELLWDCQGLITHLELFNLKEWQEGQLQHLHKISELQLAINDSNALKIKQILRSMISNLENASPLKKDPRLEKFLLILKNIPILQNPYKIVPLGSYIGTDSTSNASIRHGMGFVAPETLPRTSQALLKKKHNFKPTPIPIQIPLCMQRTWSIPESTTTLSSKLLSFVHKFPGLQRIGLPKKDTWISRPVGIKVKYYGNVITMGGIGASIEKNIASSHTKTHLHRYTELAYLNTQLANVLKILIGFIPATLAFLYTQQWWLLAFFGSTIWLAITGVRNIAQAILGGGGLHKSSLVPWKKYLSWSRISDSLMYTGLSVVLLEFIIRNLVLEQTFNITVKTHSVLVFSIIAAANGLYLACHNIFRGFPKEVIIGNIFRSILAIPVSILYNIILLKTLTVCNAVDPLLTIQSWAAIISKAASDTVAGLIEGFADRRSNYLLRSWDYKTKLNQFFQCYTQLELCFPDQDILQVLAKPKKFAELTKKEAPELLTASIINALDLMYFWMYQPYAQQTFTTLFKNMTKEEQCVFTIGQNTLLLTKEVSQLFVNGVIGQKFPKALSFYLDRHERYLNEINKLYIEYMLPSLT